MVYKVKDTANERSNGYRCDQAAKDKVIATLNDIEGRERFLNKETKDSAIELCVRQELTLRNKQKEEDDTIWFLSTEAAIYNEFDEANKINDKTKKIICNFLAQINDTQKPYVEQNENRTYDNYFDFKVHKIKILLFDNQDKITKDIALFIEDK